MPCHAMPCHAIDDSKQDMHAFRFVLFQRGRATNIPRVWGSAGRPLRRGRHRRRKCGNLEGFFFSFSFLFVFVRLRFESIDVCCSAFLWLGAWLGLGIAVVEVLWFGFEILLTAGYGRCRDLSW